MMSCHRSCSTNESKAILYTQPSLPSVPSLTSFSSNSIHHNHLSSSSSSTTYKCIATLKGQTSSYISSLTLAGKFLCTGSSDKEIKLWRRNSLLNNNNNNHENNLTFVAGKGAVKSLVLLSDRLFTAHQDHKIRVWKISAHEEVDEDEEEDDSLRHLATLPTFGDRALKLLTPNSHVQVRRHKKCTWVHHVDTVSALALSTDDSLLYSVSWDRTLKLWRTSDFKCLESVTNAHDDAINAVAVSPHGTVYTGSTDKKIKVWKRSIGMKKHSLVGTLEKHNSGVNALALSQDGSVLFSGAGDRSILVWEKNGDGDDMVAVGALRGHSKSILCLGVVGDLVMSGSADGSVRVWRGGGRSYSCLAVLEGHKGPVKCLAAAIAATTDYKSTTTSSSYFLYTSSLDCDIKVWQIVVPLL